MPTYRTNALYQAPTVDNAVYEQFGMQPGMDRLNLLPRHDAKLGWIAPNALYQIARALVSPSVAARGGYVSPEDGVNFAGNVSLGSLGTSALLRNPAPGPGRTVAQTVFHGSPHDFAPEPGHPLGRFRSDKIGTGEGAQAYGYGLYVAEVQDVAKGYRGNLSSNEIILDGKNIGPTTRLAQGPSVDGISGQKMPGVRESAKNQALSELSQIEREALSFISNEKSLDEVIAGLRQSANESWRSASARKLWEQRANALEGLRGRVQIKEGGALYHVDLPDQHIANMLDWDKPLSQQPESVRLAWKQAQETIGPVSVDMTGEQAYAHMSRNLKAMGMGGDKAASELLRSLGVPGIRYLDGGSRGAGDGTRNFVVFDDKLLRVLKKE